MLLLLDLPLELLELIVEQIDSDRDVARLCRTARSLYNLFIFTLYRKAAIADKRRKKTVLRWAAYEGVESAARRALAAGADPDHPGNAKTNREARKPLTIAAARGHVSIVRILAVEKDADGKPRIPAGRRAIEAAVASGHREVLRVLLTEANMQPLPSLWECIYGGRKMTATALDAGCMDVTGRDVKGQTPVGAMTACGRVRTVKLLLARGAEPDFGVPFSWTLQEVIINGWESLARLMLDQRLADGSPAVDVNEKDRYGRTPLWAAVSDRRVGMVKILLSQRLEDGLGTANVDERDMDGRTVLSWAAEGYLQREGTGGKVILDAIIRLLLEAGANPDLEDYFGRTPLAFAARTPGSGYLPCQDSLELTNASSLVELLLAEGARPDSRDNTGRSPLSYAAELGDAAAVRAILANKAEPDSRDMDGRSPLSYAAQNDNLEALELVLQHDPDVNARGNKPWTRLTPLLWASRHAASGAVRRLALINSVVTDTRDEKGWTALGWCALHRDEESIRALLAKDGMISKTTSAFTRTPVLQVARAKPPIDDFEKGDVTGIRTWLARRRSTLRDKGVNMGILDRHNEEREAEHPDETIPSPIMTAVKEEDRYALAMLCTTCVWRSWKHRGDQSPPLLRVETEGGGNGASLLLDFDYGAENDPVELVFRFQWTPLHYAAYMNRPEAIRMLLSSDRINPNTRALVFTLGPDTPLMFASAECSEAAVLALLDCDRVDATMANRMKRTPLEYSVERGHTEAAKRIRERLAEEDGQSQHKPQKTEAEMETEMDRAME